MQMDTIFVNAPKTGEMYKLWSLPVGTKVIREGLRLDGDKLVGPFEITRQGGSATFGKTAWDYDFYLAADLEVTVV
jgi:hypothetical protein